MEPTANTADPPAQTRVRLTAAELSRRIVEMDAAGRTYREIKRELHTSSRKIAAALRAAGKIPAGPEPGPTADPDPRPARPEGRRGVGVRLAQEAVNVLKRIPVNDPLRDEARSILTRFLRANF